VADWTKQLGALPFPLRGDHGELPRLRWETAADQGQARDAVETFRQQCRARAAVEERRLAYVAVTRARELLVCSGYWWDTATKPRGPSELLLDVKEVCERTGQVVAVWADPPADGAANPVTAVPLTAEWPYDPLGPRRGAVEAGAALVRAALDGTAGADDAADARVKAWREESDLLLAELARRRVGRSRAVELPAHLSVSQLVQLRRDPSELARQLRRPMPARPAPQARRGTRFHLWLEQRWGQQRLLDVDELPGAADEAARPDADLADLQRAFLGSEWAGRVPREIELPFDLTVEGLLLRGRVDAVFTDAADGLVDVVDWKTGRVPAGAEAAAAAVQLAVYRLAWHHLTGTPLDRIRAAFHYVADGATVRPADLLGPDELVALVRSVPVAAAVG
jgi:DNA helicase-2/ATP-dependent DNA helicase PcrA